MTQRKSHLRWKQAREPGNLQKECTHWAFGKFYKTLSLDKWEDMGRTSWELTVQHMDGRIDNGMFFTTLAKGKRCAYLIDLSE